MKAETFFYNIIWKLLHPGRLHSLITFQRAVNYTFCMWATYYLLLLSVLSLLHKNSLTALFKWLARPCRCRIYCCVSSDIFRVRFHLAAAEFVLCSRILNRVWDKDISSIRRVRRASRIVQSASGVCVWLLKRVWWETISLQSEQEEDCRLMWACAAQPRPHTETPSFSCFSQPELDKIVIVLKT